MTGQQDTRFPNGKDHLQKPRNRLTNSIFGPTGNIPLTDYRIKLVSCTADGANANMGQVSGLLTRIDHERDWILKIHRANHRVELAFKETKFLRVDEFYLANFSAMKNSGKLKNADEIYRSPT